MASSDMISKVDDHDYVGVTRFTPFDLEIKVGAPIHVDWEINGVVLEGHEEEI